MHSLRLHSNELPSAGGKFFLSELLRTRSTFPSIHTCRYFLYKIPILLVGLGKRGAQNWPMVIAEKAAPVTVNTGTALRTVNTGPVPADSSQ